MLHISLAAETIGRFFGFPITNSLLATWFTMIVLFVFTWMATRNMKKIPGTAQSIAELVIGGLYDFFGTVTGHHVKKFFPLLASMFLFVIMANWIGLLPGVGTIGFTHKEEAVHVEAVVEKPESAIAPAVDDHAPVVADSHDTEMAAGGSGTADTSHSAEDDKEHAPAFTPLLRAATADLNMTIALAIIAVVSIQYFGFSILGFHYSSKFFNFSSPMAFIVGILEFISEISKLLSFAFRLFGNIFAGEVLLAVLAFLMPFILPLPFLMMELFVGFIQALVFSMLTAVFLNVAVSHGEEAH
jgi:F-type H+-transporting ATPase subunit a